jgi:tetratricopeptide (TPR) repeat protein
VTIVFTEEVPEDGTFDFSLMFSLKGVQLLKQADSNFHLGKYKEAKEAYKDAIRFYSQFSKLYNRDKASFIAELTDYVSQCEAFLEEERIEYNTQIAEEKHQEGVTAFNNKEYAEAEQLFKQAQNMYKSVGNSEKADECQEYIDKSTTFAEQEQIRSEAEALFSEGETYFGQQLYEDAKAKFEEAFAKYTELGDEEKINECNEWILSCEKKLTISVEENGGTCAGTSIIFVILLSSGLANRVRFRRKN